MNYDARAYLFMSLALIAFLIPISFSTTRQNEQAFQINGDDNTTAFSIIDSATEFGIYMGRLSGSGDGASLGTITENEFRIYTNNTDKFTIDIDGDLSIYNGIRMNTADTTRPSCSLRNRGLLWFTKESLGVADALSICAKTALDTYAWTTISVV